MQNKKGFLFTLITFLLMFSILIFAKSYLHNQISLSESIVRSNSFSRLFYIENDILSNTFYELLKVRLDSITRSSDVIIRFNHSELSHAVAYETVASNYKDYIENTYSSKVNLDIALDGFNNSFVIRPYNTRFLIDGQNLYLFFSPPYASINSISIYAVTNSERMGNCDSPIGDGSGTLITQTFEDKTGWTCTNSKLLNAIENNGKPDKQFYLSLKNPPGSMEVKFGQVSGVNGVLAILTSNSHVNITELSLTYDLDPNKVYLESGSISIGKNKTSKIILAQE